MRKLTLAEVTITVETTEEDIPVRGAFASGDDELDRADEDAIHSRLARGDYEAWCCVVVTVTWTGPDGNDYTGRDTLGACSLDDEYTAEVCAEEHGMAAQALDYLNQRLACIIGKAKRLERALAV